MSLPTLDPRYGRPMPKSEVQTSASLSEINTNTPLYEIISQQATCVGHRETTTAHTSSSTRLNKSDIIFK